MDSTSNATHACLQWFIGEAQGKSRLRPDGLSLTATARYLRVSRRSVSRALERSEEVLARHGDALSEFIDL